MTVTAPSRHPGLDAYCADLDAIHASDAISSLTGEELSRPGSLYALPMFCWADLGAAVGRKSAIAGEDGRWLMPVRIKWDRHPVIRLDSGDQVTVGYRIDAPGLCESGEVVIAATADHVQADGAELDPRAEKLWIVEELSADECAWQADEIREAGHEAYWRRLLHLSDYTGQRIEASHDRMRDEIYSTLRLWEEWIDEATREALLQRLVLGEEGEESAVQRMLTAQIEREDIFDRVDPYRHAASFIKRAASEQVYAAIGDPHTRKGQHIRAAAAEHQVFDPAKLKAILHAESGPLAGVGVETIERALHPVPNSSVKSVELETVTGDAPHTSTRKAANP